MESEENDLMRYYYCDFIAAAPFESGLPLDQRRMDVEDLEEFVKTVKPKTRVDAFPLYVLLKHILEKIVTKQIELFSREIRESRVRVSSLLEQQAGAKERAQVTQREYGVRLQKQDARLAEREMELGAERKRFVGMRLVAEELGLKVDEKEKEIARLKDQLDKAEGMLESEELKLLQATREAESLEERTRNLQCKLLERVRSRSPSGHVGPAEGPPGENDKRRWRKQNRRMSVSFNDVSAQMGVMSLIGGEVSEAYGESFRGSFNRKGGGEGGLGAGLEVALSSMSLQERGVALNKLLSQPAVVGLMDREAFANEVDEYMREKILATLVKAKAQSEVEGYDGASFMSAVLGTDRDSEISKVVKGAVASVGTGMTSKLVCEAISDDAEAACTVLTAAVKKASDLAGGGPGACVDSVVRACGCSSRAELIKWVLQGEVEPLKLVLGDLSPLVQAGILKQAQGQTGGVPGKGTWSKRGSVESGSCSVERAQKQKLASMVSVERPCSQSSSQGSVAGSVITELGEEGDEERRRLNGWLPRKKNSTKLSVPHYVSIGAGGEDGGIWLERTGGMVKVQHQEVAVQSGRTEDKGVDTQGCTKTPPSPF